MASVNLKTAFERVVCINLDRRPDRWEHFVRQIPEDWPFAEIERYSAIDGKLCNRPNWWRAGGGAWGCYRTHLRIIEECLNSGIESVLIFEDDATFCEGFASKVQEYFDHLPPDWGMVYLGGQHLKTHVELPIKINDWVYKPFNVNRTHAYGVRGEMMKILYSHLCAKDWNQHNHIDHHYGRLHQRRVFPVYTPREWLVGQGASKSDISGRNPPLRFWKGADDIAQRFDGTFVPVIGLHRSGSSCLAMVLHYLGVHIGNKLGGYEKSGGGEAVGLANICESAARFPATQIQLPRHRLVRRLRKWIRERQIEAANKGTIAGGKYPHLCAMGDILEEICGPENLRIIHINRPLEESIESLKRRSRMASGWLSVSDEQCEAVQKWLWEEKVKFLSRNDHLTIEYHDLLERPEEQVQRIIEYLGIEPNRFQIHTAIRHVDKRQRHITVGA